ncbi:MAG: hypothetical protein KC503_14565 [Myxococcales bacterium]|nr:hypothetical protein [Myxococcales bacterium]
MRKLAAALCLTLALLAPRPAHPLEVGLEIELGTSVPVGPFPDGVPVSVTDTAGTLFAGVPNSAYNVLLDAQPVAGFSGGLSLLLGNWYLRVAVAVNTYSSWKATRYAFTNINGTPVQEGFQNIYVGEAGNEYSLDKSATIVSTRFCVGYRWYLLPEGLIRPYIPMGLGMVVSALEGSVNYGLTFHAGVGFDVHLHERVDIGFKAQYEWMGVILPKQFQAGSAADKISAAATSETSVLEAFLESLHTFQFAVTTTFRF